MNGPLECPKCNTPLGEAQVNRPELAPCPGCGSLLQVEAFPALFRPVAAGREGERLLVETEASCFYHPQKKAVVPCEGCGRFLCALCDCELHGEHFCPACLEVGKKKGRIKRLENERTLYDSIALALAVYPLVVLVGIYFTCITAPMAVYFAIRYWNAPRSIVHRTRWRLVFALVFASLQIVSWVFVIYFVSNRKWPHG
jgi:hypothetical protein